VTLLGNNVYFNTGNDTSVPRLVALDKNSGEVVFDVNTTVPELAPNQGHSAAPLAVKNMILIGQGNRGENGRGYVAAYAADTGKLLWRRLPVPRPAAAPSGSSAPAAPPPAPLGHAGPAHPTPRPPPPPPVHPPH